MDLLKRKNRKFLLAGAALLLCFAVVFSGCKGTDSVSPPAVPQVYSVTYQAVDTNGATLIGPGVTIESIFSDTAASVTQGDSISFGITEPVGYILKAVYAGSAGTVELTAKNDTYTYKPDANVVIKAVFEVDTINTYYNITYQAVDGNGASILSGDVTPDSIYHPLVPKVKEGNSISFSIVEPVGYSVQHVYAGAGELSAAGGVYTYTPGADATIKAVFGQVTYKVTYNAVDENGAPVAGSGIFTGSSGPSSPAPATIAKGGDLAFRVFPPEGYNLVSVSSVGEDLQIISGVYFAQLVSADISVTAVFAAIPYQAVSYAAFIDTTEITGSLNALIQDAYTSNPAPIKVESTKNLGFKVIPPSGGSYDADGYNIASVKNGDDVLTPDSSGVYTVSNVTADLSISVVYTLKNRKNVTLVSDHGSVSIFEDYSGTASLPNSRFEVGGSVYLYITPDSGNLITAITVKGDTSGTVVPQEVFSDGGAMENPWGFDNLPDENITITVTYTQPDITGGNPYIIILYDPANDPRIPAGALKLTGVMLRVYLTGQPTAFDQLPGNGGQVVPVAGAGYNFGNGTLHGDRNNPPWTLDMTGYPYNNISYVKAWGGSIFEALALVLPGWDTWKAGDPSTFPPSTFDPDDISTWGISTSGNPYIIPVADFTNNLLITGGALQKTGVKFRVYMTGPSWVYDNIAAGPPLDEGQVVPGGASGIDFDQATLSGDKNNPPWAMDFNFPYTSVTEIRVYNADYGAAVTGTAIVLPGWDKWVAGDSSTQPPKGFKPDDMSTWGF